MNECRPTRMKYWKELDQDEKIERMRGEVKSLRYQLREMWELANKLKQHEHLNGKIHTTLDTNYLGGRPTEIINEVVKTVDTILDNNKHDLGGNERIKKEILGLLLESLPEKSNCRHHQDPEFSRKDEFDIERNLTIEDCREAIKEVFGE